MSASSEKYPEHKKLGAERHKTEIIHEFLEWASDRGFHLEVNEGGWVVSSAMDKLMAEFIGVDLNVLEKEKRAMLEEQRKLNDAP